MSCNDCGGADTTCSDCADKRIAVLEAKLAEAIEDNTRLNYLFDLQRTRVQAATKMWQEHHGKPGVLPDLGELIEWMMSEALALVVERDALRAEVARLRAAIEPTAEVLREMIAAEWKVDAWWTAKAKATALLAALGEP